MRRRETKLAAARSRGRHFIGSTANFVFAAPLHGDRRRRRTAGPAVIRLRS